MIEENPRTNPMNNQTRILFSYPPSKSPERSTVLIMIKEMVARIPQMWWAKLTPPPWAVEASMMNHHPTKNCNKMDGDCIIRTTSMIHSQFASHTKIAATKAAVAFRVFVALNQMQDENASIIDMVGSLAYRSTPVKYRSKHGKFIKTMEYLIRQNVLFWFGCQVYSGSSQNESFWGI